MTSLEQIVLPLAESRALVEHGVKLDTALAYYPSGCGAYAFDDEGVTVPECQKYLGEPVPCVRAEMEDHKPVCPAPTLSELLDAIRAKADAMEAKVDRGMKLERHEWDGKIDWEIVGQGKGNCEDDWREAEGKDSTDLLAAYALLLEVAK